MNLPLFFKSEGLPCLVIGGGSVAARKISLLLSVSCIPTVIAPEIRDEIRAEVNAGRMTWRPRNYEEGDCRGYRLVIAATRNDEVNRTVSSEAQRLGIPVNVVDAPELCTVIFGAIWRDGPLTVTVSTAGEAPFMAAAVRDRVAGFLDGAGSWVEAAARFRAAVRREIADASERDLLYQRFAARYRAGFSRDIPRFQSLLGWLGWLEGSAPEE
jgi:uroporphyrin-III C-methyltransferase/precorrin-2 dehydrogenase/sirohydrochlorin ferrochelatase